jgi:hypothetical protein
MSLRKIFAYYGIIFFRVGIITGGTEFDLRNTITVSVGFVTESCRSSLEQAARYEPPPPNGQACTTNYHGNCCCHKTVVRGGFTDCGNIWNSPPKQTPQAAVEADSTSVSAIRKASPDWFMRSNVSAVTLLGYFYCRYALQCGIP